MRSEIAQLRDQIEMQCLALRQMKMGYAITASHRAISSRYKRLGRYHGQLAQVVGEERATEMMLETYNRVVEK